MNKSLSNIKCKELIKLKQKKYRDITNTYLVETYHLVEEAIANANVIEVFESDINTKYTYITEEQMQKLSETDSCSKIFALVKKNEIKPINFKNDIVLLDDVQDPGNLGTILRTCKAFGIDTIVLSKNCCDPYNSKVIRASQGAIFKINIIEDDILSFIKTFKNNHNKEDYTIVGTSLKKAVNLQTKKFSPKMKYLIIFGNEGRGISQEILDATDYNLFIEISQMESLNVAVSCGIILYQLKIR